MADKEPVIPFHMSGSAEDAAHWYREAAERQALIASMKGEIYWLRRLEAAARSVALEAANPRLMSEMISAIADIDRAHAEAAAETPDRRLNGRGRVT